MAKKVIWFVLLALATAGLVYGGVYRTRAVYGLSERFTASSEESVETSTEVKEMVTLQAVAQEISTDLWVLKVDGGSLVELEGRTLTYLAGQGFTVQAGDALSLTGFYEDADSFEISELTNLVSGETVVVRGADGRPLWGKGGGGGK